MIQPVDGPTFRDALARFASGVTVVTATEGPRRVGLTATAFSSLSLDPPLVLFCVARSAGVHDAVVAAEHIGVSVLSSRQSSIALQFAKRGIDRFDGASLVHGAGVPLIEGALVHLECVRRALHEAGDHTIVVAEVTGARVNGGGPLLHFARQFGEFAAEPPAPAAVHAHGGQ